MERTGMAQATFSSVRLACCGLLVSLLGCSSPMQTRYPSLWYGSPEAERKAYERHDPLPDSSMGPMTSGRPRDADLPRPDPRKTRDSTTKPWEAGPPAATVPPASYQTVRP